MKSILFLIAILLFATPLAAQTDFYLDGPFKHPAKIPDGLVRLLQDEIKSACPRETVDQMTDVRSLFSASGITINNHRPAFIVKSSHHCLTGVDNDWFWIFRETARGYRLVLTSGTISLSVLQTKTLGLRDIETNVATAQTNYMTIYKFNGSIYGARVCTEAAMSERNPKAHRVPCRH